MSFTTTIEVLRGSPAEVDLTLILNSASVQPIARPIEIQSEGVLVGRRSTLNWTADVTEPEDDAVNSRVNVPLGAGGGGGTYAWTRDDKRLAALATSGDNDPAIASAITNTPANGYVMVTLNGVEVSVGDGTKSGVDCYLSGDGGVTPRALTAVVQGDTLHWNGSVAGFQLTTADRISLHYLE